MQTAPLTPTPHPLVGTADWLHPQWPAPAHVHALCTTRHGGVSGAPYDSLNLGTHVGDVAENVLQNRARLQEAVGARPVFLDQVHGTRVLELGADTPDGQQADACFTRAPGLACTVMVADCLPILLCDAAGQQVAAVHAGWRGLVGVHGHGVLEEAYKRFMPVDRMDTAQAAIKIIAWMGPCIGPTAFEVGDEVRSAFVATDPGAAECFAPLGGGKWLANLPALARRRLHALGVTDVFGNDGTADWCTVGNASRFFSHRRDRVSGRQAALVWLD